MNKRCSARFFEGKLLSKLTKWREGRWNWNVWREAGIQGSVAHCRRNLGTWSSTDL